VNDGKPVEEMLSVQVGHYGLVREFDWIVRHVPLGGRVRLDGSTELRKLLMLPTSAIMFIDVEVLSII